MRKFIGSLGILAILLFVTLFIYAVTSSGQSTTDCTTNANMTHCTTQPDKQTQATQTGQAIGGGLDRMMNNIAEARAQKQNCLSHSGVWKHGVCYTQDQAIELAANEWARKHPKYDDGKTGYLLATYCVEHHLVVWETKSYDTAFKALLAMGWLDKR